MQSIGLMNRTLVRAVAALGLLVSTLAIAQSVPVPWNGTRDKSCEPYHGTKYKTPLYSAEAIDDHLRYVLAVDNTPKLFYRWEGPVRYYLEVPPEYPELAKLFEEQVAQVAKYTGLDIARHDKPYLAYKDDKRNDKSKWPGGLSTNVFTIWTLEMEKTLNNPMVKTLSTSFGGDVEKTKRDWQTMKQQSIQNITAQKTGKSDSLGFERYGFDPDGLKFVFQLFEPREDVKMKLSTSPKTLRRPMLRGAMKLATISTNNAFLPSIFDYDSAQLTDFDKQFLRVLYGKHVHSGMLLIKAKRLMMEELIDCFNAKAGSAKR
jgi:hypothetical protein